MPAKKAARERRQTLPTSLRPTIEDFVSGLPYSTGFVAKFFGRTNQWVRCLIATKTLKASKIIGTNDYMIDREAVRVLYGTLNFDNAADAPATLPTAEEDRCEAMSILQKLEQADQKRRMA